MKKNTLSDFLPIKSNTYKHITKTNRNFGEIWENWPGTWTAIFRGMICKRTCENNFPRHILISIMANYIDGIPLKLNDMQFLENLVSDCKYSEEQITAKSSSSSELDSPIVKRINDFLDSDISGHQQILIFNEVITAILYEKCKGVNSPVKPLKEISQAFKKAVPIDLFCELFNTGKDDTFEPYIPPETWWQSVLSKF